jgi:hypothetical protein
VPASPATRIVPLSDAPPYAPEQPIAGSIELVGSTLMQPLAALWMDEFAKIHPELKKTIDCQGSEESFKKLEGSPAVLGLLSREVTSEELAALNKDNQRKLSDVLRDAMKESQSRRNVGILFDNNRLDSEVNSAITKLSQMQRQNGMWPWFPGGPDNEYLSLYIVTGFGRLRHLGVRIDESMAIRALERLDAWMHEWYDRIPAGDRTVEKNHLSSTIALYLYGRSFFLGDRAVAEEHSVPFRFWQDQARKHWLQLNRQSQAHIAVALKRMGDKEVPAAIVKSLDERSVSNEEMGMFWRDTERSWWWYHAPIETQAMMVEAFDEVARDDLRDRIFEGDCGEEGGEAGSEGAKAIRRGRGQCFEAREEAGEEGRCRA